MSYNVWQYSRWTYIVGRSLRMNPPSGSERTAVRTFLNQEIVARPYIVQSLDERSGLKTGLDIANEPDYNLAKMVMYVGRDLKKIPMTVTEKGYVDTLIAATGNRYLGAKGGPAGDVH